MFRPPVSRNHRNKGSKVRRLLQSSVLVVVVVWLLYETRHTYESKKGNTETVSIKRSDGNADIYVSRKANPGSLGGVSTSLSGRNFYETNEVTEIGREDEAAEEAFKKENEESHVHTTDSGEEEGKADDSTDSRTVEEVIRLPSETDDSTDHSTSEDGANSGKGEATSSNEENSRSTNEAVSIREEITEVLMDKEVHDHETVERQGDTSADTESTSNTTFEQDTTNPGSDGGDSGSSLPSEQDNTESSTVEAFEKDKVEESTDKSSIVENDSESDKNGNSSVEAATSDTSEAQNTNLPNSTEEHDEAMQDSNGDPQGEVNKIEVESVSESETTVSSTEAATTDTSSEGENSISANSNGENNAVMSDNNGAHKEDEVEPQAEHGSEGDSKSNADERNSAEKTENNEGEQNSAEKTDNNEKPSADEQNIEEKTENNETGQNNAEKTENNEGEQNSAEKTENKEKPSTDEQTNAEKTENNETDQNNAENNANSEASGKDTIESKWSNASDTEATTGSTVEEATSTDEVANAAITNKDEHLELPAKSAGDSAIEGENSGNEAVEGAKPESDDENPKTSDTSTNENTHEEARAEPDSNGVTEPLVDN